MDAGNAGTGITGALIRRFVLGGSGSDERKRRLLCGRLSGTVGITANACLGLVKVFIGLMTGSVAVMADAVNNLSDAAASAITLIGFSLASKGSDEGHPFGHARFEYMTGVIVSALVIVVGIGLIITAYGKIVSPEPLMTGSLSIVLLVILIFVKLWLYRFNLRLSGLIGSASLKATGLDSRNDAISTAAALGAILLFKFAGVNIDGYIGLGVGVFIIYSGLNMVKETAGPLLGQSPDPQTVREIAELVLHHEGVLGIHDLIVHDYGPGHVFASVHIEVDSREDIFVSHALVDDIEKEAQEQLHVLLVGHMDPLDTQNPKVREIHEALDRALRGVKGFIDFHDLRVVAGPNHTNVIIDVVAAYEDADRTFAEVRKTAQEALTALDPAYNVVVNDDFDYGTHGETHEPGR